MGLEPVEVNQAYAARDVQELGKLHADYCFNCGSCSFVCPATRPLAPSIPKAPKGSRCSGCPYWRGIGCVSCYRELLKTPAGR